MSTHGVTETSHGRKAWIREVRQVCSILSGFLTSSQPCFLFLQSSSRVHYIIAVMFIPLFRVPSSPPS